MKIISKHKDYYDGVSSHGVDKTIVYLRTQVEIKDPEVSIKHELFDRGIRVAQCIKTEFEHKKTRHLSNFGFVYFCGKLYPYIKTSLYMPFPYKEDTRYYYNKESLIADYPEIVKYVEPRFTFWFQETYGEKYSRSIDGVYVLEKFFNLSNIDMTYFVENKTVCFTLFREMNSYLLTINPELKRVSFQKVFDPFSAHQTISSYISGIIGSPAMPMVQISDKDMVVSKGFDPIYGFRKRKAYVD